MLPDANGIPLLKHLRQLPVHYHKSVPVFSREPGKHGKMQCKVAGATVRTCRLFVPGHSQVTLLRVLDSGR